MTKTEFENPINTEITKPNTILVKNFSYTHLFSDTPALREVSLDISPGETIGVVGESGSGKTTFLYALSGLIPNFIGEGEYVGEIFFDGDSVKDSSLVDLMSQIAIVFQDPSAQAFGLKTTDAIVFGMENMGVSNKEMHKRLQDVSHQLQIEHLLERSTMSLSGGEAQAVAIACMLAMDPKVIMFDEAISALDVGGQERLKEIIKTLKEEGKTMIIVDSDVEWLSENVDRLVVLDEGKLTYDGKPNNTDIVDMSSNGQMEFRESFALRESVVLASNLSFSYGGEFSIKDVTFQIKKGSCTAFVGHNGSGKSTLALLISGLLKPSNGEVLVGGEKILDLKAPEAVKKVGYLFQNPSLMFSQNTVMKEFELTTRELGIEPIVSLKDFGLENVLEMSPWDLSSGQQQLLALACVLSSGPELIILDEPTLGQSIENRKKLTKLVISLQERGHTIIIISHDMKFVARTSQESIVLNNGHVVREGATKDVMKDREFFDNLGLPLPW